MTKKEHQLQASFHQKMAEHHDKTSDHHGELSAHLQSTDPEASAAHADLQGCHKAIAAEHAAEGERHIECCKAASDELEKTDGGELLQEMRQLTKTLRDAVVPSAVGIIPTSDRPQAVPRYGSRDLRTADVRKSVDVVLRDAIIPEEEAPVSSAQIKAGFQPHV